MLYGKTISIIFASSVFASPICENRSLLVIGKDGDIPWRGKIPSDMERFVGLTEYDSVVMGRKTWDSIPPKFRPLANRQNIVLTNNPRFTTGNSWVVVAHSLEEAMRSSMSETVWIMGGAQIYALALPMTDEIHWTMIYEKFKGGDTFFPGSPNYIMGDWKSSYFQFFKAGETGAERDQVNSAYNVLRRRTALCG